MSEPTVVLTGRLENWCVDTYGLSTLWGRVYGDIHGRFLEGQRIHTSYIEGLDKMELDEGVVVSTLNSHYVLGKSLADYAYEQEEAEYVGEG